jgi:hypothetical protein
MSQERYQVNDVSKKSKGFSSWPLILVGVPILSYWLIGPYASAWVQTWEAAPSGYAIIAQELPTLSAQLRTDVSDALDKGYLTNEDVNRIVRGIVSEKGQVQTYPAPDFGDSVNTGDRMLNQLMGTRQDSNAKRKLIAESENQ